MHTNRLAREKSPYLLQHAHNPVDWFPWGDEAFEKARSEQKPIFLSIGYSTCHWCHVMERESFESEAVAELLNRNFISIKVDREERPDVDAVYMSVVQAMSGSGGWPMTLFLTPGLKPIFGGTYFPPVPAHGRPSFSQLLLSVSEYWNSHQDQIIEASEEITSKLQFQNEETAGKIVNIRETIDRCFQYFVQSFDPVDGGFGGAPKFPRPVQFDFLFRYGYAFGNEKARDMALFTLLKMALGGIHDQLGGGFHRYSVDRYWLISHFEKMLYDQAQLVNSYLDAWQITHDEFYRGVVESTVEYVLRDMRDPGGGFYSAEDADSEGEEGKFYAWTIDEFENILGKDEAHISAFRYGVTSGGNFEHEKNALHLNHTLDETANRFNLSRKELEERLGISCNKLIAARALRVRPLRDDKILTSWNGLMIGAMARAGDVLNEPRYLEAAQKAAEFIWQKSRTDGNLLHRWRDGEAAIKGFLEDYAFLIQGFLDLYESTFGAIWVERAMELQAEQDRLFYDEKMGGYFSAREAPDLIFRSKNDYDGAEPSPNSLAVLNLLRLASFTENDSYRQRAKDTLQYFLRRIAGYPYAMPELMCATIEMESAQRQIVFAGNDITALRGIVNESYLPTTVKMKAESASSEFALSLKPINGKGAAYVCENFVCNLPVTQPEELRTLLVKD